MIKKTISILLLITINFFSYSQKKKVLLIGIDGLQYEQIAIANTPNLDRFNISKGYTGGIFGTDSEQSTSSSPGWMSILTGVWFDVHKIKYNTEEKLCKAPSLFKIVKDNIEESYITSISTWTGLNLLLKHEMHGINFATIGGTDILSTRLIIEQIKDNAPDFAFVQLDEIDTVGHQHGFGKAYTKKIEETDKLIGNILDTVTERENNHKENWLVIIVTDHGRGELGKTHGEHTISQKTIFIGMNKKGNKRFKNQTKTVTNIRELETLIPQTAIVPTILKYLDIPIKEEWHLNSKSLIDN